MSSCRTPACLGPPPPVKPNLDNAKRRQNHHTVPAGPDRPSSDTAGQPALLMESLVMAQQFGTAGALLAALPALRDDALLSCYARRVPHLEL